MSTSSNSTRCAACKYLRRRCGADCDLAPYFPSTHPERFACVHRIFGASNVSRMLQRLPDEHRARAADAISSEAYWRVRDPVYGSVGVISMLQHEIQATKRELAQTQAEMAIHSATWQAHGHHQQPPHPSYNFEHAQPIDQFNINDTLLGLYQPPEFP